METPNRSKKLLVTAVAGVGLMLGAAGVASAVGSSSPAQTNTTVTDGTVEANETNEANEANETPESEAAEDAAELKLLNSFPVTPDEASATALAAVPGTVDEVEISDDTATPVFEVEIIDANGQEVTVTVDPNSGAVIDQVVEAPDADEANEGPETNEAPAAADDTGVTATN